VTPVGPAGTAIAVLGGYGTFGTRVCRGLAARGHRVTVAGRHVERASALARSLGEEHHAVEADAADLPSCRRALRGAAVVAVCAGPFSTLGSHVARAALEEGCHYVDIADDRAYIRTLRALDGDFARAGRSAVFGCSTLPALSSALALSLLEGDSAPEGARVTLFIGNDNVKGGASVRAMMDRLGGRGQGSRGFGDPQGVTLPAPFGRRKVYTFDGPEAELFPSLLGVRTVDVRLGFELSLVNAGLSLLSRTGIRWGAGAGSVLARLASLVPRVGSSGGAVLCELTWADGRRRARAVLAETDGQRMAALPCELVADALALRPGRVPPGVSPPTSVVPADVLLAECSRAGMRVVEA